MGLIITVRHLFFMGFLVMSQAGKKPLIMLLPFEQLAPGEFMDRQSKNAQAAKDQKRCGQFAGCGDWHEIPIADG